MKSLVAIGMLTVGLSVGCGPADVAFSYDNRTDVAICEYGSPEELADPRCLPELSPQATTRSGFDCDGRSSRRIRVLLALKDDGRLIYDRAATCGEWNDSGGKFVIERNGSEFIVTDSLPDGP